jgi:hypothetical protein
MAGRPQGPMPETFGKQHKRRRFWQEALKKFRDNESLEIEYRARGNKVLLASGACMFRKTKNKTNPAILSCVVGNVAISLETIQRVSSHERELVVVADF